MSIDEETAVSVPIPNQSPQIAQAMIRIGLAIYLIFATVAGPWFCCCSATRLANALGQLTRARESHVNSCSQRSGCCSCRHAAQQGSDESPPKPRCPCHDKHGAKVAPTSGFDIVKWVRLSLGESAGGPLVPVSACKAPLPLQPDSGASSSVLPFLTAQDMLRALHNYLC